MTRLGAVSRLVRTLAAHAGRGLPLPMTPNGSPGLVTTGIWGMLADTHRRGPSGFPSAAGQLEEGRLVVRNRCPPKNRNIPDESTIFPP
jgi:hypothetical protein